MYRDKSMNVVLKIVNGAGCYISRYQGLVSCVLNGVENFLMSMN